MIFYVFLSLQEYPPDIYHNSAVVVSHKEDTALEYEPALVYSSKNCLYLLYFLLCPAGTSPLSTVTARRSNQVQIKPFILIESTFCAT